MKQESLKKNISIFIILVLLALILFSTFSIITIKTNVNIIDSAILTIKNLLTQPLDNTIARMQTSLSRVYRIALIETLTLTAAIIVSLLALNYLIALYFSTKKISLIDELTGAYNKRALYRILTNEISRAKRFKHPLTLAMFDLDFFKVYNDNQGHVAGDLLLKRISKIALRNIRDVDTFARYGGEEFVIILPETSHEQAVKVAERIRKTIEKTHFKGEEKQPKGKITISMGLVTFHGEYKSRKKIIESADELLYKAKEEGRNQLKKAYFSKTK